METWDPFRRPLRTEFRPKWNWVVGDLVSVVLLVVAAPLLLMPSSTAQVIALVIGGGAAQIRAGLAPWLVACATFFGATFGDSARCEASMALDHGECFLSTALDAAVHPFEISAFVGAFVIGYLTLLLLKEWRPSPQ